MGYAEPMQQSPHHRMITLGSARTLCRLPNHCGFWPTFCGRVIAPRSSQQWWMRRRSRTGPRRHTSVVRISPSGPNGYGKGCLRPSLASCPLLSGRRSNDAFHFTQLAR